MSKTSKIFKPFQSQGVRYGGYAAVITFVVVVALVVVNLIVGELNLEVDLTRRGLFTLSEQSMNVIESIDEDVTIYVLAARGQEPTEILAILRQYSQRSPRIRLEVIDAAANPGLISRYDPENEGISNGSLIVAGADNFRVIPQRDLFSIDPQRGVTGLTVERRVSNALIYVGTGSTPVIYEITGHGEVSVADLQIIPEEIERENYEVRSLNLILESTVPDDAAMVLMVRPRADLNPEEARKLREYLLAGGKGVFLAGGGFQDLPVLNDLFDDFGIELRSGIVLEGDGDFFLDNATRLIPVPNAEQEIIQPILEENVAVVLPNAQGLRILDRRDRELNIDTLLSSSPASYLRTDPQIPDVQRNPADEAGPFPLAVAIELVPFGESTSDTRLVVASSAGMAGPVFPYGVIPGNVDFIMNSIAWAQNRSDAISVRPKSLLQFPLQLSATEALVFSGIFVVLIPLVLLVTGLVVWLRRRHL